MMRKQSPDPVNPLEGRDGVMKRLLVPNVAAFEKGVIAPVMAHNQRVLEEEAARIAEHVARDGLPSKKVDGRAGRNNRGTRKYPYGYKPRASRLVAQAAAPAPAAPAVQQQVAVVTKKKSKAGRPRKPNPDRDLSEEERKKWVEAAVKAALDYRKYFHKNGRPRKSRLMVNEDGTTTLKRLRKFYPEQPLEKVAEEQQPEEPTPIRHRPMLVEDPALFDLDEEDTSLFQTTPARITTDPSAYRPYLVVHHDDPVELEYAGHWPHRPYPSLNPRAVDPVTGRPRLVSHEPGGVDLTVARLTWSLKDQRNLLWSL